MHIKRLALMVGVIGISGVGLNGCVGERESGGGKGAMTQAAEGCGRSFQAERVANMKGETLEETMGHFAEFDDLSMAETSAEIAGFQSSPVGQIIVVTNLSRVRRVLEEGRKEPGRVLPVLRGFIERAPKEWPAAIEDRNKLEREAEAAGKGYSLSGPDFYDRVRVSALAATYLVAELKDVESLKPLVAMHRKLDLDTGSGPVAPTLTLYAIHRLIEAYPKEKLSERSRELNQAYWKLADGAFDAPKMMTVTAWNSAVDDTSPMVWMFSEGGEHLKGQPTIEMEMFPAKFKDGALISERMTGVASERGKMLFEMAEAFVKSL